MIRKLLCLLTILFPWSVRAEDRLCPKRLLKSMEYLRGMDKIDINSQMEKYRWSHRPLDRPDLADVCPEATCVVIPLQTVDELSPLGKETECSLVSQDFSTAQVLWKEYGLKLQEFEKLQNVKPPDPKAMLVVTEELFALLEKLQSFYPKNYQQEYRLRTFRTASKHYAMFAKKGVRFEASHFDLRFFNMPGFIWRKADGTNFSSTLVDVPNQDGIQIYLTSAQSGIEACLQKTFVIAGAQISGYHFPSEVYPFHLERHYALFIWDSQFENASEGPPEPFICNKEDCEQMLRNVMGYSDVKE